MGEPDVWVKGSPDFGIAKKGKPGSERGAADPM
jgi:hypothetical protein